MGIQRAEWAIFLLSVSSLLACSGQNSGFATSANTALCSGSTCTALLSNNPSIFISTQGAKIPKLTSFLPSIPLFNTGCTGAVKTRRTDYSANPAGCANATPTPIPQYDSAGGLTPVPQSPLYFSQRTEVSGTCSTGQALAHKITYAVRNANGNVIGTDLYGATYGSSTSVYPYSKPTYCDNGRYSLLITPPKDDGVGGVLAPAAGAACAQTAASVTTAYCTKKQVYYLTVYLWTGPDVNNLSIATSFETSFSVQF